jgi:hypothetical protein
VPLVVSATFPVGVMKEPDEVSVTVTVQVVEALTGIGEGLQLIEIDVVLGVELTLPLVPLLAEC